MTLGSGSDWRLSARGSPPRSSTSARVSRSGTWLWWTERVTGTTWSATYRLLNVGLALQGIVSVIYLFSYAKVTRLFGIFHVDLN